jgi:hypothetical protein
MVIAGLLITSAVSITASENMKNMEEKDIIKKVKLDRNFFEVCPNPVEMESSHKAFEFSSLANTGTIGEDDPIGFAADEFDIVNPSLLDDGGDNIVMMAEGQIDFGTSSPLARYSNDGGQTWLPEDSFVGWEGVEDYIEEKPSIDFDGETGAFGSMIPYDPVQLFTVDMPDVSDPDAGDGWVVTIWNSDDDIDSCDVAGHTSGFAPTEYSLGIVCRTGDASSGETNILWLSWVQEEGSLRNLWTGSGDDLLEWENVDCDTDLTTGMHFETYEVYDYEGYPDGVELDWCQLDGTDSWWEGDWYWTGGIIEAATNPDVKADDGNVYLAYEFDGGIRCLYSNDISSFTEVVITDDGQFPAITAVGGTTVICTYTRDGDLYASISENGGETWVETSSAINDEPGSVEEQHKCQHVSGGNVVWTDNRVYPPLGIMFDTLGVGEPPSAPEIDGVSSGKAGTAYTFKFTSTEPNGKQISYFIDWDDGDTSGYTPLQGSGTPYSESHVWDTAGTYTIRAKAKNEDGLVGPVSTHEIVIEKSKTIGFNPWFIQFLQQFPIFKFLLGI